MFPLTYWEFRLWLAINVLILLITSEILQSTVKKTLLLNKKALNYLALMLGAIFVITVIIQAYETWIMF